jgi:MYXO-CTERM domain-containing protein
MHLAFMGVIAWRLFEVQTAPTAGRFVEIHNAEAGCWFPTTQVAVYDGAGTVLDAVAPFTSTTCFPADTFLVLGVPPQMPAAARQVCLRSSGTIYDCVRWSALTVPVHDLFGPDDDSVAVPPPAGYALARIADSDVVADDWIVAEPTPGGPNDGTPYVPPDAGPGPDAGPPADAGIVPDAGPRPDAGVPPDAPFRPDAGDDRYLDLDAQGGAGCGCQSGGEPGAGSLLLLLALCLPSAMRYISRR